MLKLDFIRKYTDEPRKRFRSLDYCLVKQRIFVRPHSGRFEDYIC